MPDYTADPTDVDLQAFLTAAGVWKPSLAAMLPGYAAAAVERFETLTGRRPYLAGESTTLYFDPQGATTPNPRNHGGGSDVLELDAPFTSVTAVALGCSLDNPDGSPLDIGRGVFLKPDRREIKRLPVEWLRFVGPVWGAPQSIGITGTPGSVAVWPADDFNAVLAGAAADLVGDVVSSATGKGLASWKEADASEVYGELKGAFGANIELWKARFASVVSRRRLIRLGL